MTNINKLKSSFSELCQKLAKHRRDKSSRSWNLFERKFGFGYAEGLSDAADLFGTISEIDAINNAVEEPKVLDQSNYEKVIAAFDELSQDEWLQVAEWLNDPNNLVAKVSSATAAEPPANDEGLQNG